MTVTISAVVAMSENNCIGKNNDLPWHIPADLKRFKSLTTGKPVIMGRKTFDSIFERLGKPLPNRTNIVVTRQNIQIPGVIVCHDIESAVEQASAIAARDEDSGNEIIIGGGAEIYKQALPFTDNIYLTRVHQDVDGDAWFPEIKDSEWQIADTAEFDAAADGQHPAYSYSSLSRK